ncbi:MAG: hypothetical protein K5651_05000 [Bacteroidales bacterium]|nr:hypothetical protein [Bacteroidales bacterium]
MKRFFLTGVCGLLCLTACENLMKEIPLGATPETEMHSTPITLSETARLLSQLPIGTGQMGEVHDAVTASIDNGFDEEYMLSDLFTAPGSGVGDRQLAEENSGRSGGLPKSGRGTKADGAKEYTQPLRDLIRGALVQEQTEKVRARCHRSGRAGIHENSVPEGTKGEDGEVSIEVEEDVTDAVEERIRLLCDSGVQIYWPYSENWDGETLPVITFDPGDGFDTNIGWRLAPDGSLAEEVTVDEEMARNGCVWVINSNEDCELQPLSYLRKTDPTWGLPDHGTIVVGTPERTAIAGTGATYGMSPSEGTKATKKSKTLLLKKFTAKRHFDNWFSGGSEFFVKIGKVEDFKATTEAEMQLYKPSITDFMVAVKRKDIGKELDFNALLVSEWTDQLSMCAFLITEDDGGTITKWDCNAVVKINSKSFGFEISIPINSKDDIVWRGQLSGKYINATANLTGHFGDVDLVFEVVEY